MAGQEMAIVLLAVTAMASVISISVLASRRSRLVAEHEDLVENADAIVWWLADGADAYGSLSAGATRVLGHDRQELIALRRWFELVHPDDREQLHDVRDHTQRTGDRREVDFRMLDAEGRWRWLREVLTADPPAGRRPGRLRGVDVDVTARRAVEAERARYHQVVEHIQTAILVLRPNEHADGALVIEAANPAAGEVFGTEAAHLVGRAVSTLPGAPDDDVILRAHVVARGGAPFSVERVEELGRASGRTFSLRTFGLPGGAVGMAFEDVTSAAMVAAALRRQALHDGLTGLPNRTLLRDRLRTALAEAKRRNERVALLLLDLNHFKDVNDTLGHQYGDRLLSSFASRLRNLLRDADTIARLGGDEFALLLTRATEEGSIRVAEKVTEAMQEPFDLHGVSVKSSASLGIALYPDHAEDADLLTQRADVAMYTAKRSGGGWRSYSPAHDQTSLERLTMLADLHAELERGEPEAITVLYQPVLDLRLGEVTGVEATLSWDHPSLGRLEPAAVVEIAELSGLADELTRFVLREAITANAVWRRRGLELRVAVDLTARDLRNGPLLSWIPTLLRDMDVPADALTCELTESDLTEDAALALEAIGRLHELGIRTAIDAFGTGYSSLAHLRRLPIDEIKVDPSFVTNMADEPDDHMLVRTVIVLAHNLGRRVLADGVEDERALQLLRELGCDRVQGDLIGHPMDAGALAARMRAGSPSHDR